MAKERNFNPVQAQRKADKAKAIKKGRSSNMRCDKLGHSLTATLHRQSTSSNKPQ